MNLNETSVRIVVYVNFAPEKKYYQTQQTRIRCTGLFRYVYGVGIPLIIGSRADRRP